MGKTEFPAVNDPDYLPSYNWSRAWGDRVFWFDAFICHNRGDGSADFQRQLTSVGIRAWHDRDESMRDRKVQQRVALALMHSRYVVVYLESAFKNSVWCQAEYLPALEAGRNAGGERVLVAVADPGSYIPAELDGCRRFNLYTGDLVPLANCLRAGNHLNFDSDETLDVKKYHSWEVPASNDQSWKAASEVIETGVGPISAMQWHEDLQLLLDRTAEGGPGLNDFDELLMALRCEFQEVTDARPMPEQILHLYRRVARAFTDSVDNDNRANALMIFEQLADLQPSAEANRDVIEFLRREAHEGIIGTTASWLGKHAQGWSDEERCVLQLAVLRGSNYFRGKDAAAFVATLPEAVRIRVQIPVSLNPEKVLKKDLFAAEEALALLEERLDHIVSKEIEPMETELFLVELDKVQRDFLKDSDCSGKSDILSRLLEMYSRVVLFSQQNAGRPLTDMGLSAYEWFLLRVSRMVIHPEIRVRAIEICYGACEVLERHGASEDDRGNAQAFKRHLQRLEEGIDLESSERTFRRGLRKR